MMKTLTAFTAVAALVAGISVASAAGTMNSNASATSNNLTASGSAYCNKTKAGSLDCKFASMAACEKVAKPNGGTCITNPKSATTGSGASSDMNKTDKSK